MRTILMSGFVVFLLGTGLSGAVWEGEETPSAHERPADPGADTLEAYTESIPGTVAEFEMVPVPGGSVTIDGTEKSVDPFWMAAMEVRWDAYDAYRLDEQMDGLDDAEADAISLPSKPYGFGNEIPGFGRDDYPALAVTRNAAQQFARWVSAKTGHTYRLPTPAEWKHACRLGHENARQAGEEQLREWAWYDANSGDEAQPTGTLEPSSLGVYDQLGNAAEHVVAQETDADESPEVWGGSYQSEAGDVHCSARVEKVDAWQASDPQLPKSEWWLSDAPFVGFRLVRVEAPGAS